MSVKILLIFSLLCGWALLALMVGDYQLWSKHEKDKRELSDDRFIVDACGLHFYERDDGYIRVVDRRKSSVQSPSP